MNRLSDDWLTPDSWAIWFSERVDDRTRDLSVSARSDIHNIPFGNRPATRSLADLSTTVKQPQI